MHPTPRWFHRLALLIAVLAAIASTWPVARYPFDHIIDGARVINPQGDPNFSASNIGADVSVTVWILNWTLRALVTQPLALFDSTIFYPSRLSGARQEHLFATDLLGAPGALVGGPVFAHQTAFLLCIIFNVWAAAYVVARWTGSLVGALVAGVLFGASPFHQSQIFHLQSLGTCYLLLLILGLERFCATGGRRWAALVAISLMLQVLSGQYLGYMAMVVAVVVASTGLLAGRAGGPPRAGLLRDAGWLAAAAGVAVLVTLPFLVPYLELAGSGDIPDQGAQRLNSLYTLTSYFPRRSISWRGMPLATWVLAFVGVIALLRERRGWIKVVMLVGVCVVGALLSLGPRHWLGSWRLMSAVVPGFGAMREPVRFVLLPCLAMALLGGVGAAAVARWRPRIGTIVASTLGVWAAFYAWNGPLPLRTVPVGDAIPEVYRVLARCGDGDPLVEVPIGMALDNWRDAEPQLMAVHHWLPLLNGRASYSPPELERTRRLVNIEMLMPERLAELRRRTGVRWVLVHCDGHLIYAAKALCEGSAWQEYPSRTFTDTNVRLFDLGRVDELPRPVPRRVPPTTNCLTASG